MAVIALLLAAILGAPAGAPPKPPPTVHGFPIYPPEAAASIAGDAQEATLPLRSRAKALEAHDFKSIKEVMAEMNEAGATVVRQAAELGWLEASSSAYSDGGSSVLRWAKITERETWFVTTTFWSGMVIDDGDRYSVSPEDKWGTIGYSFFRAPAPAMFSGFPVWSEPGTAQRTELPGRLQVDFVPSRDPPEWDDMVQLPVRLGWERRFSPLISEHEAVYVKGDRVAHLGIQDLSLYRVTLYAGAAGRAFLAGKPEKVKKTAVVKTGCLIQDGRYLRPPYQVELVDGEIRINGVLIEREPPGPFSNRALENFELWVKGFKNHCLDVRCGSGSGTSKYHATDREIRALLSTIDKIVKSKLPREEKLRRLRDDPALNGFASICAEELLEHWDGFR